MPLRRGVAATTHLNITLTEDAMRKIVPAALAAALLVSLPATASAIPAWARKYNMNCSGCHAPAGPRPDAGRDRREAGSEEHQRDDGCPSPCAVRLQRNGEVVALEERVRLQRCHALRERLGWAEIRGVCRATAS